MANDKPINDNTDTIFLTEEEAARAEEVMTKAIALVEAGRNLDQAMDALLATLPPALQEKLRKRIRQMLEEQFARRKQAQPKAPDVPRANVTMAMVAGLITRGMYERIQKIMQAHPNAANQLKQAGERLAKNGVTPEMVRMRDVHLGSLAPPSVAAIRGDKDQGRTGP